MKNEIKARSHSALLIYNDEMTAFAELFLIIPFYRTHRRTQTQKKLNITYRTAHALHTEHMANTTVVYIYAHAAVLYDLCLCTVHVYSFCIYTYIYTTETTHIVIS